MDYLYTYLLGSTPVIELRGAIPAGYLYYDLSITTATVLGILGSITLALICLASIPLGMWLAKHIPLLDKLITHVLNKTRKNYSHKMTVWGEIFLVILVAIPLPGSGAFTGSVLAFLFGIKNTTAFMLISLGVIISGLIVAALTLSGASLWSLTSGLL